MTYTFASPLPNLSVKSSVLLGSSLTIVSVMNGMGVQPLGGDADPYGGKLEYGRDMTLIALRKGKRILINEFIMKYVNWLLLRGHDRVVVLMFCGEILGHATRLKASIC